MPTPLGMPMTLDPETSGAGRRRWLPALLLFLVLEGALLLALAAGLYLDWTERADTIRSEGASWLNTRAGEINRDLAAVTSDLGYLIRQPVVHLSQTRLESRERVEAFLLAFARRHEDLAQIRLLDAKGKEWVRVDNKALGTLAVPPQYLQDKSDRDYVVETMALAPLSVHVSRLDLNIENGEVQWPPDPQIRLSTRLPSTTGTPGAILVLNMKGAHLLERIEAAAGKSAPRSAWLVDGAGEYLLAPHDDDTWGFVLGHDQSLANDHPDIWRLVLSGAANLPRANQGAFQYLSFDPLSQARENARAWGGTLSARPETDRWVLLLNHALAPWYMPHGLTRVILPLLFIGGTLLALLAARGMGGKPSGPPPTLANWAKTHPTAAWPRERSAASQWLLTAEGKAEWGVLSPEFRHLFELPKGVEPILDQEEEARLRETLKRARLTQGEHPHDGTFTLPDGKRRTWEACLCLSQSRPDGVHLFSGLVKRLK